MKSNILYFSVILLLSMAIACKSRLMSYDKFSKIKELSLPKITHLKHKNNELLYFGAYHSNSSKDSLFVKIESEFVKFKPDFVLYEGSNWPISKDRDSTISISGEPGFIIQLAQQNKVKHASIEPNEEEEYNYLLKKHELEWVVLMYMCRQIDNQQRLSSSYKTTDQQFIQNINYFLRMLVDKGIPLANEQLHYSYWKKVYENRLGEKLVWRKFNPDLYYPNKELTKMNEVNRTSDEFRNLKMIDKIFDVSERYDRVMVLVGGGHLIVQEKMLKNKFYRK